MIKMKMGNEIERWLDVVDHFNVEARNIEMVEFDFLGVVIFGEMATQKHGCVTFDVCIFSFLWEVIIFIAKMPF